MPINFPDAGAQEAIESLRKALSGETLSYSIGSHPLNSEGNVSGVVTGGNLSILYALTGSPSDIQTENKILFLEDLDEYLYHVDRMMMGLKRSGKLAGIKAILAGGLTKMNDNTIPFGKTAEQIIAEYARELGIPVCFNFPAGHFPDNRTLILGREVHLNIEPAGVTLGFMPADQAVNTGNAFRKILKPILFFLGFIGFIYAILYLIRLFIK
jgi:muramoyltetrapeptide carboxypeptidase